MMQRIESLLGKWKIESVFEKEFQLTDHLENRDVSRILHSCSKGHSNGLTVCLKKKKKAHGKKHPREYLSLS